MTPPDHMRPRTELLSDTDFGGPSTHNAEVSESEDATREALVR